jgi:2-dehydro-3-deoxyphosphogluconate aldolase/(4S)-4-hydroxy-2-oxoglutarate aldolase
LYAGGITAIEFTLTGAGAFDAISRVRSAIGNQMLIGRRDGLDRRRCRRSDCCWPQFIVTPAVRPFGDLPAGIKAGIPTACGAMTPTEALTAHEAGAAFI